MFVDFQTDVFFFDSSATQYDPLVKAYNTRSRGFLKMQYVATRWIDGKGILPSLEAGCFASIKRVIIIEDSEALQTVEIKNSVITFKKDESENDSVAAAVRNLREKGFDAKRGFVEERSAHNRNLDLDS